MENEKEGGSKKVSKVIKKSNGSNAFVSLEYSAKENTHYFSLKVSIFIGILVLMR